MDYKHTVEYIHSLGRFSHPPSLQRISAVMEIFENVQNRFKTIHIAGTNGKGSVCSMVSNALKSAGYKTGVFVSPFIVDFCERIQINGEYIPEKEVCSLAEKIIATGIDLTEFEFITAMGFLYFAQNKIDVAVIETGLGGRFDATNVIQTPLVSVITKIGLDHTAVLGDTLEKITAEKCGIIKEGKTVTSHNQQPEVFEVIKNHTNELIIPRCNALKQLEVSPFGNRFIYEQEEYKTSLGGLHQIENALVAIHTLENCGLDIAKEDIKSGLANTFVPARLEIISRSPLIIIDGAHNPDGAQALAQTIKQYNKVTALICAMADKDYTEVFAQTLPFCENVICTNLPQNNRSLDAKVLSETAKKYCKNVYAEENLLSAMQVAKQKAGENPLFVFGSLYLASAVRPLF